MVYSSQKLECAIFKRKMVGDSRNITMARVNSRMCVGSKRPRD